MSLLFIKIKNKNDNSNYNTKTTTITINYINSNKIIQTIFHYYCAIGGRFSFFLSTVLRVFPSISAAASACPPPFYSRAVRIRRKLGVRISDGDGNFHGNGRVNKIPPMLAAFYLTRLNDQSNIRFRFVLFHKTLMRRFHSHARSVQEIPMLAF